MEIALQTVEYLHREMDYVPWAAAGDELSYVDTMLSRTALYGQFQVGRFFGYSLGLRLLLIIFLPLPSPLPPPPPLCFLDFLEEIGVLYEIPGVL